MEKDTVAVMFGGRSAEHEISVITALQAIQAFDTLRYTIVPVYLAMNGKWYTGCRLLDRKFYRTLPGGYSDVEEVTLLPDPSIGGLVRTESRSVIPLDVCFLAFHGQYGEDGCVQGLLELADLPYTSSNVLSISLSMNKFLTKAVAKAHRIPVLPSVLVHKREAIANLRKAKEKVFAQLSFPVFVKPNHLGSSIAISSADDEQGLVAALAKVFQYDNQALVEPKVTALLELNVAVMAGNPPIPSVIEIPIAKSGALSYEDKYMRGGNKATGSIVDGMAGLSRVVDPADLDASLKRKILETAVEIFDLLECSGVCRLDFMLDTEKDVLYFNEINPIPGSLAFYLWDNSRPQVLYTELICRMIEQAKQQKAEKLSLGKEFGFHAL